MAGYDVIVLGVGGVGSAALFHLAARGARVLGLDRFEPGHDRGSSHGETRLIRQAYYEHPSYVPMVQRAFALWHELEQRSGQLLYNPVGLLQIGLSRGEVLTGVRASASQHGLPIEELTAAQSQARFPGFRVPDDFEAIFEARAGYLLVEDCVRAHAAQAVSLGAELHAGETVREWRAESGGVVVVTDREAYRADRLIVTAGAWASQVLVDLQVPFVVLRKPLYWWRTRAATYHVEHGSPGFLYELPEGCFYGFPQIDDARIKVAEHTGGTVVNDPLALDRTLDEADRDRVARFIAGYLPDATTECVALATCMYTMTPDTHFVVDRHPRYPQVSFAAGLSGHGFKFTPALGEVLCGLALDGRTTLDITFLSTNRPALSAHTKFV